MWDAVFDYSTLTEPMIIVSCPKKTLVEDLMNMLAENGITWSGGAPLDAHDSKWNEYKEETCYWIENGRLTYGDKYHAERYANDYSDHIKCTFFGVVDPPDFNIASEDELQALLGIGGG